MRNALRTVRPAIVFGILGLCVLLTGGDALAGEEAGNWRKTYDLGMMWVNFLILALVLIRFGRQPIKDFLNDKKDEISLEIKRAEQEKALAEEKIQEAVKTLEESEVRFAKIKTRLVEQGKKERQKIIENAKKQSADIKARSLERWFPSVYTVKKGDELHTIAGRKEIYNDSYQWPLIYKANRDQIRDPRMIFSGQNLVIPRDITIEELRDARKQAGAPEPYDPPPEAFHPSDYRAYRSVR